METKRHSAKQTRLAAVAERLQLQAQLEGVLAAFSRESIPTLVFKGAHLATHYYESFVERDMCDIDVLIPEDFCACADYTLRQLGFEAQPSAAGRHAIHQTTYSLQRYGPPLHVDLHWQLSARQLIRKHLPVTQIFAYSQPWSREHTDTLRQPDPALALLILAVHACTHHRGEVEDRDYQDARLILQRFSPRDLASLCTLADSTQLGALLRDWLKKLAASYPALQHQATELILNKLAGSRYLLGTRSWPSNRWHKLAHDLAFAPWPQKMAVLHDAAIAPSDYLTSRYPQANPKYAQITRWLSRSLH